MATVLLVDDEQEVTEILQGFFSGMGLTCWAAKNSREALTCLQEHRPTVVFLDIQLKGSELDGFGILAEAKKLGIPSKIVIVTGYPDSESETRSKELGADDYLVKPLLPAKLLDMVKKFDGQKP